MTHRLVGATVLALVLGGVGPAFAATRPAAFVWEPATGPVAGYAVFASIDGAAEALVAYVNVPSATFDVEASAFVSVRVAAYDSAGRLGPRSTASAPVRLCPGDFNGDETLGITDWSDVRSCLGQAAQGFCAAGDLDGDGAVGLSDLYAMNLGGDACPPAVAPTLCLGDFDGDHVIGVTDWSMAKSCLGKPAVGVCAAGDFDGDGTVSMADYYIVVGALGTDLCAN